MFFSKSLIASALLVAALTVATVSAARAPSSSGSAAKMAPSPAAVKMRSPAQPSSNITIAIVNKRKFCMFLPPAPGLEVAPTEEDAIAFCQGRAIRSSRPLPKRFIRSARYYEAPGKSFVQVTGKFRRGEYSLSATDGGGQYDSKNVIGSSCVGFPYFVALVEPDVERYCIRCCVNKKDCPINKSHLGCAAVIPELA
ncbi:hypothetical protein BGZ72_010730 [Mortierella alpina]|nr:hypothetical protein BGZ72_010730 [Mortierella alpina]